MKSVFTLAVAVFISIGSIAQTSVSQPSAESVLKMACEKAKKENKNVLLMFHASWCGWCHRMDTSLNDPSCKKFFDENYIITHLVIDEYGNNKVLENPGAYELRKKYHGEGQGIPFWLIFDSKGSLLADSKLRGGSEGPEGGMNVGCPANEAEVNYFIEVLRKTSRLKEDELEIIKKRFRENDH